MHWKNVKTVLWVAAGLLAGPATALAADIGPSTRMVAPTATEINRNPWAEVFVGLYYTEPSGYGAYSGFIFSPKRDVWGEGWLVKVDLAGGRYLYTGNAFVDAGVTYYEADVMVGYRHNFSPSTHLTLFIGPDFSHTNHPDPVATPNGTEWGVKVAADFSGAITQRLGLDFYGSVSSIRTNYFAQVRLPYAITQTVKIGPEVAALGSGGSGQYRLGAFGKVDMGWGEIGASAGNQWREGGGSTGLYASATLTVRLR